MWEDIGLYWAWRGLDKPKTKPPTEKRIQYAKIIYPSTQQGLAVSVFENGVKKEVHRDELEWHRKQGAIIIMPN